MDEQAYDLHQTPSAAEAEVVRRGPHRPGDQRVSVNGSSTYEDGRPVPQHGYEDPHGPLLPKVEVSERPTRTQRSNSKKDNVITVHGYMHKQGKRTLKGPVHKSWKRRYFALEGTKIFYFHTHIECRQYFSTRNLDLVIGAIDLKDALQLRPCARLDLPYKGFEVHTKRRIWVLCPEADDEYRLWFEGLEEAIISCGGGNIIERKLPNVRKYCMKGIATYRFVYLLFLLAGMAEIAGMLLWLPIGIEPCHLGYRERSCDFIYARTPDEVDCSDVPFSGYWTPPEWYLTFANVDDVKCFHNPPIPQWVSFFALVLAETLSIFFGALYYLGMWKPVRRGAHYFDEFDPRVPDEQWPQIDVIITHHNEPAEATIDTLMACVNLQYPPNLLQIYILDDGYCSTKYTRGNPIPEIELNKTVMETAGDLRQEVAQFMFDRVNDVNDDMEVYAWRKLHSSANLPSHSRPRVVTRADCAVGSFRDDYKYAGLPHVTFIGRVKPPKPYGKAGNINNCLYNEGMHGRYVAVFDTNVQPHPKFLLATLPFFFEDEDHQARSKFTCVCTGCNNVAKVCCASCKQAGVPEECISYCSKACHENDQHVRSDVHRRQVNGTVSDTREKGKELHCTQCDTKLPKSGVCRKCKGETPNEHHIASLDRYFDENAIGYVQTPLYYRDCVQLQVGDPLGHRNSTFHDAIQTGQDGYNCTTFAGTNALIRRDALDSIGGIQYGSLTEDLFTGERLRSKGWKGIYYRKDFEGEASERIRLAEGVTPGSVAATMALRKRSAKGHFQVALMSKKERGVDPEWVRPVVSSPKRRPSNSFMRRVFYWNATLYPLSSIPVILLYYITLYYLYTGFAPIYLGDVRVIIALAPKILTQGLLSALSNRGVANIDVVRAQDSWFVYAFTNCMAVLSALWWKVTCSRDVYKAHKPTPSRGSFAELPNVLVYHGTVIGIIWSLVRFMAGYMNLDSYHGASKLCGAVMMGMFVASKLGSSVRMSIQEYFGWSYKSLTDKGNFMGSTSIAFGLMFIIVWVYIERPQDGD